MQEQSYTYVSPIHGANLNNMRLSGTLCDVSIKVENKVIQAHRVILAANLKYFESMFLNSFQERQRDVVTMENVGGSDLEAFVNYAYTGEILLTDDNAFDLLEVADYFGEDGIKKACIEFLEIHLKAEDAFRAYKFANAIECLSLKNAAKVRIMSNFKRCRRSGEYLDLDFESVKDVLIDVRFDLGECQQEIFGGVMDWITHALEERRIYLNELLQLVDMTELAADCVVRFLESVEHREDDFYSDVVNEVLVYYHNSKAEQSTDEQTLMIVGTENLKLYLQFYNFTQNKWSSREEISGIDGIVHSSGAVLNNKLYYIIENLTGNLQFEVFDPTTKRSTTLNSPGSILWRTTICACSRFVYLCGGQSDRGHSSDQVLRYDPQTDSFESLAPMKDGRCDAAAVFYRDCLCVLGGTEDGHELKSVEKYDPDRNRWMDLAPMCEGRWAHEVAVLDGKLYSCGGKSDGSVEVYDPSTITWRLTTKMIDMRVGFLAIAREGKLLCIGGGEGKAIQVYDPNENRWQMDHKMSTGLQIFYPLGGLISASFVASAQ